MASFAFTKTKDLLFNGSLDLSGNTVRMLLVMTNTSITTAGQEDLDTVSAFSVLDEMDGASYVRKLLSGKTITRDDTNNRAIFTSSDAVWTTLGAGTRAIKGVLIYKDPAGTNVDSQNIPLFWIDGGFPITANGTDFTLTPAATGWVYLQ